MGTKQNLRDISVYCQRRAAQYYDIKFYCYHDIFVWYHIEIQQYWDIVIIVFLLFFNILKFKLNGNGHHIMVTL